MHRSPVGGNDVLLIAAGPLAHSAVAAARQLEELGLGVSVIDPRWVLPARAGLAGTAARCRVVVTVEDGLREGGMGSAIAELLHQRGVSVPVVCLGLPRAFVPHGGREELLEQAGLSSGGIADAVLCALPATPATRVPAQHPPRITAEPQGFHAGPGTAVPVRGLATGQEDGR